MARILGCHDRNKCFYDAGVNSRGNALGRKILQVKRTGR